MHYEKKSQIRRAGFFLLGLALFALSANSMVMAQTTNPAEKKQKSATKTLLNSSNALLKNVSTALKSDKRAFEPGDATGNLALAYDHQKHAIDLYNQGIYEKALYHSIKARKYALSVLKKNREQIKSSYQIDVEKIFSDFNKDKNFYKELKKVTRQEADPNMGIFEAELDTGIEVSSDDLAVDPKSLINVK